MSIPKERKRNDLLSVWLYLMLITNLGIGFLYILLNPFMKLIYPNINPSIFYGYTLLAFLNTLFVVYLFKWKRWSFYAVCIMSVLTLLLNYSLGFGLVSLFGLSGIIILYLAMKPQWDLFD